jgi:hypothetical protein
MKKLNAAFLILIVFTLTACKKNGTGGNNAIAAFPKHHEQTIPNAIVYIKYGATELPGVNASDFDDSKIAVKEGTSAAHAHFEGLLKGNYYIYSVGYDSAVKSVVKGGVAVKITSKSGEKDVDVPVTE